MAQTRNKSYCSVPECFSYANKQPYLHFHSFPANKEIKKKWVQAIRREEGPNFVIKRGSSYVCSRHFTSDDYVLGITVSRLKPDAVPSLFQWNHYDRDYVNVQSDELYVPLTHLKKEKRRTMRAAKAAKLDHDYAASRPAALTDADLRELRTIAPGAAVLTSLGDSDTDTASEKDSNHQPGLPEPWTPLLSPANRELSPEETQVKTVKHSVTALDQNQVDPEPLHIKEEQEEVLIKQEADDDGFPHTPVPVKSENDEDEAQYAQLHQTQTVKKEEPEPEYEAASAFHPQTQTDGSSDCDTDDSDFWNETIHQPPNDVSPDHRTLVTKPPNVSKADQRMLTVGKNTNRLQNNSKKGKKRLKRLCVKARTRLKLDTHETNCKSSQLQQRQTEHRRMETGGEHNGDQSMTLTSDTQVLHSQALSTTPLRPWMVVHNDGEVMTTHCTSMAGLGEACSRITATLSTTEAACLSLPCVRSDSSGGKADFAEGYEIDFTSPARKRSVNGGVVPTPTVTKSREIPLPTPEENEAFYDQLMGTGVQCAVLSLTPKYAPNFMPKSVLLEMPKPLSELYDETFGRMNYPELSQAAKELFPTIQITHEKAHLIEQQTRNQAKCKIWFGQRSGRITASQFKSACWTDPANPSISLIKRICYPDAYKSSTEATRYGCDHENVAHAVYEELIKEDHEECEVSEAGLYIHPDYPFLGASPDGHVKCQCCGQGIFEVKCPFCLKEQSLDEASERKQFYLDKTEEGTFQLNKHHVYYYQVQLQLLLSEAKYCDFVVWTEQEVFVQRIHPDKHFINDAVEQAKMFYIQCILPELLGKWYSRTVKSGPLLNNNVVNIKLCYCQNDNVSGNILECESGYCKIGKFHQTCLGLKNQPRRKWLCPDCRTTAKTHNKNMK